MRKIDGVTRFYRWLHSIPSFDVDPKAAYLHGIAVGRNTLKKKMKAKAQRSHKLLEMTNKAFDQLYERIRWLQAENNVLAVKLSEANERLAGLEDMAKDAK